MAKPTQKGEVDAVPYSNKVFQVLLCLDEATRKRLFKYLRSPYFVQSKPLLALCELLSKEIDNGHRGFDRQKIWAKVFPGTDYDDVNFRKCCSDLLKHAKSFMAFELLAENPRRQSEGTLEFVVEHKVEPLYKSCLQEAKDAANEAPYRSLNHFKSSYAIERHYFTMMDFGVKVDTRANLEEISNSLDLFYWIEKLKICSSALSQQRTGNQRYDIKFGDDIVIHLRHFNLEEIPELAIYYYSFLTLKEEENVAHYYKLRKLLDQYGKLIPQKDAVELIDSALHYCTGKMNKGSLEFHQEFFDLFEDALKKEVFFVKGELAVWRFNNMIAAALRLGKIEWAEKFARTYHKYLPQDTRENTYTFNLARIYRFQGKYDMVLELLQNVDYEDIGYNLISKMMLLITYYELQEFDTLLSFTESFKTFLIRHKNIPPARRQGYLNLIKYTRKLMRLNQHDKAAVAKLRNEVSQGKANIINHEWLLEKLR